jgi:hypothetical protein
MPIQLERVPTSQLLCEVAMLMVILWLLAGAVLSGCP